MTSVTRTGLTFLALVTLLGTVAALAPAPSYKTDRDTYEATARHIVVPGCSELHCFRVLVPWVLGRLPGSSLLTWKTYAVVANAAAGIAVGRMAVILGLAPRAAVLATWIAAFGAVPMFTLFDPFTADPLMFLLAPLVMADLVAGRRRRAGIVAATGIFAKEFAAAPLWIFTLWAALRRRWDAALQGVVIALGVTLAWVALQLTLMVRFHYSYGGSSGADLLGGGFITQWLSNVGPRAAVMFVVGEFGALLVLLPAGVARSGRDLRLLALAACPAALALSYVQQPDRALWNFAFIFVPLAAVALQQLSNVWCALFIVTFALANLRIGAQLRFLPPAAVSMAISAVMAACAAVVTLKNRGPRVDARTEQQAAPSIGSRRVAWGLLALELVAASLAGLLIVDMSIHKRVETTRGENINGYRGVIPPVRPPRAHRVAVVGGSAAYGYGVDWRATFPYVLQKLISESRRLDRADTPPEVVNLAAMSDGAASYVETLQDYASLGADIVCVYDGYADPRHRSSRRTSLLFRAIGYVPARAAGSESTAGDARVRAWDDYDDQRGDVAALSCERDSQGYCDRMIATVDWALAHGASVVVVSPPFVSLRHRSQQQSLAAALARRFAARAEVRYVSLGGAIDLADPALAFDHLNLTPAGHRLVAERLLDPILDTVARRDQAAGS